MSEKSSLKSVLENERKILLLFFSRFIQLACFINIPLLTINV